VKILVGETILFDAVMKGEHKLTKPRYLVFDVESVADGELVSKIRYPGDDLAPEEAVDRYRAELMKKFESDFIPYTFHVPVAIAIAKIDDDLNLIDLVSLDSPKFRPHVITENFWRGWHSYDMPTFVTFNGRTFDIPLMELAAFRYGISVPSWFNIKDRTYEQKRNRYNQDSHLDLQDVLTNFSATRFNGGLNLAANILGKPGKMGIAGHMVQDLHAEGQGERINDYCRCDVLDTYFVFLRASVLTGQITLEQEQAIVIRAKQWLTDHSDENKVYTEYLERSGDWENPWTETDVNGDLAQ